MAEETEILLFGNRNERLKKALNNYGKTIQDLEQYIDTLIDWMKTQPHLPEIPGRAFLSNIVVTNKCSIEKCKEHLDFYYSLREVIPEIFRESFFKRPNIIKAHSIFCYALCPKLTNEGYRVSVCKITTDDATDFNIYHFVGYLQNIVEVRMINDVMMGEIFVVDMDNIHFAHISKLTPTLLKKVFMCGEKAHKNLMKQLHFINISPVVEHIVGIVKQLVSKKLSERIYAHQNIEGLYKHFSKEFLPKEYGGSEYTMCEIREKWDSLLEKYEDRLKEIETLKTDESKRPTPLVNDELLGYYGNFKKLNVD